MFKCGRASVSYVFALKQEKWDGLSEQDKAALDGTSGADAAGLMGRTLDAEEWEANIGAHNAGVSFYSTTGVVLAQAREDFTAAEKVWVGQAKSAGMKPPLAVLAALRREIHHQDNA